MIRATALLVLTVFAGTPAASLACEFLCGVHAATNSHAGCHADADTDAGPRVTGVRAACHQDAACPILTDVKQAGVVSAAGSASLKNSKVATIAPATDRTFRTWWPVFEGPPLRGPARPAILRI